MDEVKVSVEVDAPSLLHQLAKTLLAATAGFISVKLVENAYDKYILDRSNDTVEG